MSGLCGPSPAQDVTGHAKLKPLKSAVDPEDHPETRLKAFSAIQPWLPAGPDADLVREDGRVENYQDADQRPLDKSVSKHFQAHLACLFCALFLKYETSPKGPQPHPGDFLASAPVDSHITVPGASRSDPWPSCRKQRPHFLWAGPGTSPGPSASRSTPSGRAEASKGTLQHPWYIGRQIA
ncbi:Phosphatidylinositol Phosphatase Ptprq [Manis pentadactyla]|nr:Phosphatidylinositol Phosphatase Ptprq [Manis pentadactyla]